MKMNLEYFQIQNWMNSTSGRVDGKNGVINWGLFNCLKSALSENGIVYYAMVYCFGDIKCWSQRVLINFCCASILFDILIASISWMVAQTPINHTIF